MTPPAARFGSRAALGLLFAFLLSGRAGALSIRIAPLALVDTAYAEVPGSHRPEEDLARVLAATALGGSLDFPLAEHVRAAPLSFLDAARLCELGDYPFLIYGFLRKRDAVYSSELKLLSREGKRIAASFFATDDEAHYDRLIADLSAKIAEYFLSDLGVAAGERPPVAKRDIFELPFAAGYWAPAGDWAEGLMGIFCADLGLRFVPRKPLSGLKSHPFYLGIGLEAEYALGKSLPGFEASYLHRIQVRLPLELFLKLRGASALGLALGGLAEFDILRQERKYGGGYVETSSAGGFLASLLYRYALSDRAALGFELEYDAIFYSHPLSTISPRLSFEYSFAKKPEPEGD